MTNDKQRERLTTDKTKIFARENPTLMSMTKAELRKHYNEIFDSLQEYEVAEEQGQLRRPPCKVGDKVYALFGKTIKKLCVNHIDIHKEQIEIVAFPENENKFGYSFNSNKIGKTVFLTREEAEEALKGGAE